MFKSAVMIFIVICVRVVPHWNSFNSCILNICHRHAPFSGPNRIARCTPIVQPCPRWWRSANVLHFAKQLYHVGACRVNSQFVGRVCSIGQGCGNLGHRPRDPRHHQMNMVSPPNARRSLTISFRWGIMWTTALRWIIWIRLEPGRFLYSLLIGWACELFAPNCAGMWIGRIWVMFEDGAWQWLGGTPGDLYVLLVGLRGARVGRRSCNFSTTQLNNFCFFCGGPWWINCGASRSFVIGRAFSTLRCF